MKNSIVIIATLVALAVPGVLSAQYIARVAVLPIKASAGIDEAVVKVVEDNLLYELRLLIGYQIVSVDEINKVLDLEQQKQMLGCDDISCVINIAGALGVDKLVITNIGKAGTVYAVSTKLVSMETGYAEKQAYRNFISTSGSKLLTIMQEIAYEIFPDAPREKARRKTAPEVEESSSGRSISPFVWVFTAVGAAGLGTGIFGSVMLAQANSDRNNAKERGDYMGDVKADIDGRGNTSALLANIGYSIAAAGALSAVLVYFLADGDNGNPSQTASLENSKMFLSPFVTSGELGVGFSAKF